MLSSKIYIAFLSLIVATITTHIFTISPIAASPSINQQKQPAINWLLQGKLKVKQQDYVGALSDFTQAIATDPDNAEAYYERGLIYVKYLQQQPLNLNGTIPSCKKIDDLRIICPLAVTDRITKNQRQAIADFTQAIQINPQYAQAYHQRGLIQEETKKKLVDLQVAKELYLQQSLDFLKHQKFTEAIKIWETIDNLYATVQSLNKLAILEEGNDLKNPTNSSNVSPESCEKLEQQARLALKSGDVKTAIQMYKRLVRKCQGAKYKNVQAIIQELQKVCN